MRFRPTRKPRRLSKRKALRAATAPNPWPGVTALPPTPPCLLVMPGGRVVFFRGSVPARSSR